MAEKFRAVIQFNLNATLEGESAELVARELHKGMTDILKSMGAEMDDIEEPGLMTMQGQITPVAPAKNNGTISDKFPN